MNYAKQTSPYIRKETSVKRMMFDVLIALLPLVIFAIYRFGMDALVRILLSAFIFVGVEVVSSLMKAKVHPSLKDKKERFMVRWKTLTINHVSAPLVSAVIFAMIIPSSLSLYVVSVGALAGSLIAKAFFGGLGSNIFNPAGVGRVVIGLSFTSAFSYPGIDVTTTATPLGAVKDSLLNIPEMLNTYSLQDLFLGNIPGSMGEISAILIILGGLYMFIRKAADFRVTLSMILSFSVMIAVAALAVKGEMVESVLYHVLSGGLLFGAVFMMTDPVTSPVTKPGRWIYGLVVGAIVAFIRLFGAFPEGVVFAILLGNIFVPLIDYYKWSKNKYSVKFIIGYVVALALLSVIVLLGIGGIN
ncbi:MAG: RnfABCDGE type electron transport complex subunit D [Acholeplasma sp.]|nr:RnfABCDGE type electron transport complex subunit D [Acholeplasma sp.]